jgi:hypothetical protein
MALITPAPLYYDDVVLTIDGDDYAPAAAKATLDPSVSTAMFHGLKPGSDFPASSVDWSLALSFAQDWTSTASLSRYLFANQGTEVAVTLKPKTGEGPEFTMTVHIVPGSVGGDTRAFATTDVTLPLVGVPVLVEP